MKTWISPNITKASRDRRGRRLAAALVAASLMSATACGDGNSPDSSSDGGNIGTDEQLTLRIGPSAFDPSLSPLWLAQEAGFFEDENLNVEITVGGQPAAALVGDQVDVAFAGPGSGFAPVAQGQDTKLIYAIAGLGLAGYVGASTDVESIEECSEIGSAPPGSTTWGWAEFYNDVLELDVELLPFTDAAALVSATRSGQVDCSIGTYGSFAGGIADGSMHLLIDTGNPETVPEAARDFPLIESSLFGLETGLQDNREAVVRFTRAFHKGVELLRTGDPEELVEILQGDPDWQPLDADTLAATLETLQVHYNPGDGRFNEEFFGEDQVEFYRQSGLDFIEPSSPDWTYEARVDTSYYDEAME